MPNGLGGMAMSMKEKFFVVWILAVVAFSLVFHHFWAGAIQTLAKAVALHLAFLPGLVKFAIGVFGAHFLP
jgi:hypothetical protein